MRPLMFFVLCLTSLALRAPALAQTAPSSLSDAAAVVTIDGAIGPATAAYITDALDQAAAEHARVVILKIDTPGGLASSMRTIIQAILASDIPVIGYVSPEGARAASAGTYILYATHVAAMAPATNLGAATPVPIMGQGFSPADSSDQDDKNPPQPSAEQRKVLNDSVAYIRALAQRRDRNVEWAENAVREAASLTADAALELHVINLISPSATDLLMQIDGRTVQINDRTVTLHTAGIPTIAVEPGWRITLLGVLSNPTLAYLLFLGGLIGLAIEATHPGTIFPGVTGAICLLFALFAFQILPVNYAGLALMFLGIGLMVTEAFVATFGALGIGGVIAFVLGSILLMDTNVPGFEIALSVIVTTGTVLGIAMLLLIVFAVRAHRRIAQGGSQEMLGDTAIAITDFEQAGQVRIHGEIWRAQSKTPVQAMQSLKVVRIRGLTLYVEPEEEGDPP